MIDPALLSRRTGWLLLAVLLVHGALALSTLDRQGINWDEQTDLDVAEVYASSRWGLVYGSAIDAINTRLPMFSTGLLFRALDLDRLLLARALSVFVGTLAIVGVYFFVALERDRSKGLVAAGLLATSPYFIYFSRQALTEGDVWITGAVAWLFVAYAFYRRHPRPPRAVWVGVALGVALSAKISAVALVPALAWAFWRHSPDGVRFGLRSTGFSVRFLLVLGVLLLLWMTLNTLASLGIYQQLGLSIPLERTQPLLRLGLGVAVAIFFVRGIRGAADVPPPWTVALVITLVAALLTFFLLPPIHTTNPRILAALGHQFFLSSGSGLDVGSMLQSAAFHVEVLLIKSSLGIGLCLLLAWGLTIRRRDPSLSLPLASLAFYALFLLVLPWAQTRYIMPLLIPLVIIAADAFVDLHRRRRRLVYALTAVSGIILLVDFVSCYPDLNLNGYPAVGERYVTGRSTVGYRSIVHTPSDGIEQALRWVEPRVEPEQSLATVFLEVHITKAVLGSPSFRVQRLTNDPVDLSAADWVVTSINYDIAPSREQNPGTDDIFAYPYYDRQELERNFEQVYTVTRTFDLEVASVWRRRPQGSFEEAEDGAAP